MNNHKGCGSDDCCHKKEKSSHTPLAFYGTFETQEAGTTVLDLTPPLVPIGETTRFGTLAVNIDDVVPAGSSLTVEVLRNGLSITSITYGGTNPATGNQQLKFSTTFSPGDTVGLRATGTGPLPEINIAASLTPR